MPNIFIRDAVPEDAPLVIDFIISLAQHEGVESEINPKVGALRMHLRADANPRLYGLIAELDGAPAGMALYCPSYLNGTTEWVLHMHNLAVFKKYRRLGVGQALVRRLAQVAQSERYLRIRIEVLENNLIAKAFYDKIKATADLPMCTLYVEGEALTRLART
jgi:ribosomal protein S18 acetylase RimI-like enzyme